jgi:hypothetical protein
MKFTQQNIESARINLSEFVIAKAKDLSYIFDFGYKAVDNAPNDYDSLLDAWQHAKRQTEQGKDAYLPIWNGASDSTIYTSQEANYAFRFWHDCFHCAYSLEFDTRDEISLGLLQVNDVKNHFGNDSLEAKLMLADTVGQSTYAAMNNGEFPENQIAFVLSFLNTMKGN